MLIFNYVPFYHKKFYSLDFAQGIGTLTLGLNNVGSEMQIEANHFEFQSF